MWYATKNVNSILLAQSTPVRVGCQGEIFSNILNKLDRKKGTDMMNSNSIIPKWNLIQQCHQEQSQEEENSSHVQLQNHQNHSHLMSMSDNRMRELIWENGQPTESGFGGMGSRSHGDGGFNNNNMGGNSGVDTLESIVDQATKNGRKYCEAVENDPAAGLLLMKKRLKSSHEYQICSIAHDDLEYHNGEEVAEGSRCETMIIETTRSVKTREEDSAACHAASENQNEENQIKEEVTRSHQTRSSHAADTHKQSERKRRDRINQKMKALQKLVPNACKTDKASMLDEVIEYMKQLKAQINLMVSSRSVHDQMITMMMMMPSLGMQQQLQMSSLLARMATSTSSPIHHHQSFVPFIHPGTMTAQAAPPQVLGTRNNAAIASSVRQNNEYYYRRFLAQCMNMELYNNMRPLCTHQSAEKSQKTANDEAK